MYPIRHRLLNIYGRNTLNLTKISFREQKKIYTMHPTCFFVPGIILVPNLTGTFGERKTTEYLMHKKPKQNTGKLNPSKSDLFQE